ncbi:unnamed protein product [Protopolystoma xenopodis]|uniref:Uncharacterized protein n=1 Tax=Protopolystoma xenopodis TaxID=117903 RepID=A0A3S5BB54_9PLAT|nr:unnamed protein product [Protopolystoma xenopodis]
MPTFSTRLERVGLRKGSLLRVDVRLGGLLRDQTDPFTTFHPICGFEKPECSTRCHGDETLVEPLRLT